MDNKEYSGVTEIRTTADLKNDAECIEHLNKFREWIKHELVSLRGSFGEKYFIYENNKWTKTQ